MKFKFFILIFTIVLFPSTNNVALGAIIHLGAATDYNAFIRNDFSATSSDVEGRVAAGGNVDISSYSVNIKGSTQLYSDTSRFPALVVGGDLSFNSGQVAGDVHVGGSFTPTSTGSVSNGSITIGGISPINFDNEFSYLSNLANNLSLLDVNSNASALWSTQYLTGSGKNGQDNDLHVFNLDASSLQFSDYLLSEVDMGDTVLFNIAGKTISTSWGNFGGSDNSLSNMSDSILFNFYEAESLDINAALYGSVLAPKADITAPHGVIWGQVIANSWVGNAQINDNPFDGDSVDVPEPSTIAIFALGMIGLASRRFKLHII
jgi:choice-of-anchor A domain-containing protein